MTGFKEIAPYLMHPLVLVGFVLLLVFGVHRALLTAQVIPPLTTHTGGKVVQSFLRYGFAIALVVIILGFALAFYQTQGEHDPIFQKGVLQKTRLDGLTEALKYCQRQELLKTDDTTRREVMLACAQAVVALTQVPSVSKPEIEEALARLEHGDAQGAKVIFKGVLQRKTAEGNAANQDAAEAARHLGALAFDDNTTEALAAYRKAVELDPNNAEGWNSLGLLLVRGEQWNDAATAFQKVKAIAESRGDQKWQATGYSNLGRLAQRHGDLAAAEGMYKKALVLYETLGKKEGLVIAYLDLGRLAQSRGDVARAHAMMGKSLDFFVELAPGKEACKSSETSPVGSNSVESSLSRWNTVPNAHDCALLKMFTMSFTSELNDSLSSAGDRVQEAARGLIKD